MLPALSCAPDARSATVESLRVPTRLASQQQSVIFPHDAGNVASLPENHLSPGQPAIKLREDLFAAKNSSDLLTEMLSSITLADAADVKQVGWAAGNQSTFLLTQLLF